VDDGFWDLADKAISLLLKNPQSEDDRRTIERLFEEQEQIIRDLERGRPSEPLMVPLKVEGSLGP